MAFHRSFKRLAKKFLGLAGAVITVNAQDPAVTNHSAIRFRAYDASDNYSREVSSTGLTAVAVLSRTNAPAALFGLSWEPVNTEGIAVSGIQPTPHYLKLDGLYDVFCSELRNGTNVCYAMDMFGNRLGPEIHGRVVADALETVGPRGDLAGILAEYAITRNEASVIAPYSFQSVRLMDYGDTSLTPFVIDIRGKGEISDSDKFTFIVYSGSNGPNPAMPNLVVDPTKDGTRVYTTGGKAVGKTYALECSADLKAWRRLTPGAEGVTLVGTNHVSGAFEVYAPKGISGSRAAEFFRAVQVTGQ